MVGCPLAAAAVLSCKVQSERLIAPHLTVRTFFDCSRWTCRVTQPVQRTPSDLRNPSRLRFRVFGRYVMSVYSSCL